MFMSYDVIVSNQLNSFKVVETVDSLTAFFFSLKTKQKTKQTTKTKSHGFPANLNIPNCRSKLSS